MKKRFISILLTFFMIFTLLPFQVAAHIPIEADFPSDESENIEHGTLSELMRQFGDDAQDPFDFVNEQDAIEATEKESLPSYFDLRNVDGKSYITRVKSQAPFGSCWSFAAIAAAESSILASEMDGILPGIADGYTTDTLNLSEKQVAYYSTVALHDPSNPQNGEGVASDGASSEQIMGRGGNAIIATNVFASGIGPVHEDTEINGTYPYKYQGKNASTEKALIIDYETGKYTWQNYCYDAMDDWSLPESLRFQRAYSLRESRILPAPCGINEDGTYRYNEAATLAMKQELMKHRAIDISFCADSSQPTQNPDSTEYISENWAHYTYKPMYSNHAVTVVGWDDNYPKENFLSGEIEGVLPDGSIVTVSKTPPADGAWLVKNSWGSGEESFPDKGGANWGLLQGEDKIPYDKNAETTNVHTGYFWLSYYDQSLLNAGTFIFDKSDIGDQYTINQYDYMNSGSVRSARVDDEIKMANVFQASECQVLEEVSCMTTYPNTEVTYEVYLIADTLNGIVENPEFGICMETMTETYEYGGFHKCDINDVLLQKDQLFAIIVTQKVNGQYAANVMAEASGESMAGALLPFVGIINEHESFLYVDGMWMDYADPEIQEQLGESVSLSDELDIPTFDNFPIKAFCRKTGKNLYFNAASSNSSDNMVSLAIGLDNGLYHTSDTLRIAFYGDPDLFPDESNTITWFLDEQAEGIITVTQNPDNPHRGTVTALNETPFGDPVFIGATVEAIGTTVLAVYVHAVTIGYDVNFPFDNYLYEYTGEPVEPDVNPTPYGWQPVKDVHYTMSFDNNINCGIATVTMTAISPIIGECSGFFVIYPTQAVIESLTEGGEELTVKVMDQSDSGLSGYRIQYREEGTENWQEVNISAPATEAVITGLTAGKKYEVRAAGYIQFTEDEIYMFWGAVEEINYGRDSDIVTSGPIEEKSGPEEPLFPDVPLTHSYYNAVKWAAENNIAKGYKNGLFGINDDVTRGQVVMFLWRAAGQPAPEKNTKTFSDVPTTHSYYKAIQWASEQGIAAGYSGDRKGIFGVNDNCTRGQIVTFLWRYADKPAPQKNTKTFSDVPTTHPFYKAIQWASEQNITAGYKDGTFGVNKTCTRGHCVTFLYRMLGQ